MRQDKRILRTRGLLHVALIDLMIEKGYDNITVQDILDKAQVGRATFYAHFKDKEALLKSNLENLGAHLIQQREEIKEERSGDDCLVFVLVFFKHLEDVRPIYESLVAGEAGFIVERHLRKILCELIRKELPSQPEMEREARVQFLVGALMSLSNWWVDYKVPLTGEELYARFLVLSRGALE